MACALLLSCLLPLQGMALVLEGIGRPAHYHLQVDSRPLDATPVALMADDTVLEVLSPEAAAGQAAGDASSARVHHHGVGYHRHAPGDPGVVYVDDSDGNGFAKHTSDGMVMFAVVAPAPLQVPRAAADLPDPDSGFASLAPQPLKRPPR